MILSLCPIVTINMNFYLKHGLEIEQDDHRPHFHYVKHTTQKHVHYGKAIFYLFTTVLHSGILGALMTFTSQPWYPYYTNLVTPWGLTPIQDQQLAGLIMWIPGDAVFTVLTIRYFAAWLHVLEQRSNRFARSDRIQSRQEPN